MDTITSVDTPVTFRKSGKMSLSSAVTLLGSLFILKIIIVMVAPVMLDNLYPGIYNINSFPDGYASIAMNLVNGDGYKFYPDTAETLLRTPGYIIVLVGIFTVFGKSLAAVQVFNIIMTIAAGYILWLLTRKLTHNHHLSWIPGILLIFHPGIVLAESRGGVESLLMMLIVIFVYVLYKAIDSGRWKDYLIAGCVFGVLLQVKSTPLFFPGFLALYLLTRPGASRHRGKILVNLAIFATAIMIIQTPWIIRNYNLTNQFIATTTLKGVPAHQGIYLNRHTFSGRGSRELLSEAAEEQNVLAEELGLPFKGDFFQYFYTPEAEVYFYTELLNRSFDEYLKSPMLLVKSCLFNFYRFWFQGRTPVSTSMNFILTMPLLIISFWGIIIGLRSGYHISPLLVFMFSFIIVHLPLLGLARYHIPLVPFLLLLGLFPFINHARVQPATETSRIAACDKVPES